MLLDAVEHRSVEDLNSAPERPERPEPPGTPGPPGPPPGGPLRTVNYDDLRRNRLTVGFRLILGIPHLLWVTIWGFGMLLLVPVLWVATLVNRRPPDGLHEAFAMYVRYVLHVYAYMTIAADPYPGFLGRPGTYPIDLEVPPPADHNRWTVGFRLLLAIPPLLLAAAFVGAGGSATTSPGSDELQSASLNIGLASAVAVLAWFTSVVRGRMAPGLRDLLVWALGYAAQAYSYLLFLTPRYPNSDPAIAPVAPLPDHPVRLRVDDDLHRNRLTVAFRLILAVPHIVWITLWSVVGVFAAIAAWVWTLAAGRPPATLQRFLAALVRYWVHFSAFVYLAAGPFPGFTGTPGYPVELGVPTEPERQPRLVTLFRLLLAVPAFIVASAVGTVMGFAAVGGWFASLATGRMPLGLRNAIAFGTRYNAQTYAYLLLLTPRYPYGGPADFR
jgi:hypothetical protein